MKSSTLTHYLCVLLLLCPTAVQGEDVVTFTRLLQEMSAESSLAEWPASTPYTCHQASSYSRESRSQSSAKEDGLFRPASGSDWGKGWFENHDFNHFIREENNQGRHEQVLMEDEGPGAIVRFWATYGGAPDTPGGTYRIYLDGEKEARIALMNKELVGGSGLVGAPFSFCAPAQTEKPTWDGRNLLLPIPYAKACKITYEAKSAGADPGYHYYQINYRKYQKGVKVESFSPSFLDTHQEEIQACATRLTQAPKPEANTHNQVSGTLSPHQSMDIKLDGAAAISFLECKIQAEDQEQALRSTVLKISFDGNQTVWCPLGQFFGIAYRQLENKTFYIQCDKEGNMTSRWLMPFGKNATLSLHNYGSQNVTVHTLAVSSRPYHWGENSMYFHAAWTESKHIKTDTRWDYNFITIQGKGIYVGDNLTLYNTYSDWWGEGDEKIFVDGEKFPSHFGTGTEDYYSYAWCRPQIFHNINVSQPLGEGNKTTGLTSNNRYRLLDTIPFTTSYSMDMEIWHAFHGMMNYSPATFWYAFKGAKWNYQENVEEVQKPVAKSVQDVINAK